MDQPKQRPIPFSGAMVRAILDGRKTQTRRAVSPQPIEWQPGSWSWPAAFHTDPPYRWKQAWHEPSGRPDHIGPHLYGAPGDRLWVRERARLVEVKGGDPIATGVGPACVRLRYEADGAVSDWLPYPERLATLVVGNCIANGVHREGARLFLGVVAVRVERLHDISEADARAEGFVPDAPDAPFIVTARDAFRHTWLDIYGAASWNANPWVWVVTFSRVQEGR